jgi:hypothetical protein
VSDAIHFLGDLSGYTGFGVAHAFARIKRQRPYVEVYADSTLSHLVSEAAVFHPKDSRHLFPIGTDCVVGFWDGRPGLTAQRLYNRWDVLQVVYLSDGRRYAPEPYLFKCDRTKEIRLPIHDSLTLTENQMFDMLIRRGVAPVAKEWPIEMQYLYAAQGEPLQEDFFKQFYITPPVSYGYSN